MTDEEIKQQQEAEAEAARLKEAKEKEENIDYKAELEKTKKQLGQAEHTILKLKSEKDKETEEEDDPAEKETVEDVAKKEARKYFVNLSKQQAENFAHSLSTNDDEFNLIMFHYENSLVPTGNIEEDIKTAKLLANRKRIDKDMEQLRRANLSKETRGADGGDGGQKQPIDGEEPQLSDKDKKILRGFTWDAKRKGYIGPSGRFHSKTEIDKSLRGG